MAELSLIDVTRTFGRVAAVDRVSLGVADGEFLTLLGPSGSGKTTLLRMIGGYTAPSAGTIHLGGRRIDDLPPERRNIGMVFQQFALFPHMTVAANVGFGLARRGVSPADAARRVADVLGRVRLEGLEDRYPRELSGGQQQRVALARALVIEPALLLLDEPMSSLDASLRRDVRREIVDLHRAFGVTTVLVTHDQEDALALSTRIAVVSRGQLQQIGTPGEIYDRPANRFVAEFIGRITMWPAHRVDVRPDGLAVYEGEGTRVLAPAGPADVLVGVRPGAIVHGAAAEDATANVFPARVESKTFHGDADELVVTLSTGLRLTARLPAGAAPDAGGTITLNWSASRTVVISVE